MTAQEIDEAEKLIASMRDDLSLIAGTNDPDKLAAHVREKVERMLFGSVPQIFQHIPRTILSGSDCDLWFNYPLSILFALAELAERPEYKVKLLDAVAKQVPIVEANLDKIEQQLATATTHA